ncbi:MAG TPA: hypothetical protein VIK18_05285, partial [Pirellulales bacterium]
MAVSWHALRVPAARHAFLPPRRCLLYNLGSMLDRTIQVTINGTGFAADYTARSYALVPHKNGVRIVLAGVTS